MGSRRRDNSQTRSLHCRGYDIARIGEQDLREVFSTFGKVIDVYLPKCYFTKKVRGFAYIQFESEADADAAREKLDRTDIFEDHHVVNIMWAAGERKTPNDMKRLDIERDNPYAKRIRERERMERGDRDWGRRDRGRDRRDGDFRGGREWDRGRPRDWSRDWDAHADRYRDRSSGYGGGRPLSRSPPSRVRDGGRRFDDRDERRDQWDGRRDGRPDVGYKRRRSRSPSFDYRDGPDRRRRRRSASRSPPPIRRRSISPPTGGVGSSLDKQGPRRSRSRSQTPPRSRSPYRGGPGPSANGDRGGRWRERDYNKERDYDRGGDDTAGREKRFERDANDVQRDEPVNAPPKLRSVATNSKGTHLSPVETTPASHDSR